jgi:hypothetical protein
MVVLKGVRFTPGADRSEHRLERQRQRASKHPYRIPTPNRRIHMAKRLARPENMPWISRNLIVRDTAKASAFLT